MKMRTINNKGALSIEFPLCDIEAEGVWLRKIEDVDFLEIYEDKKCRPLGLKFNCAMEFLSKECLKALDFMNWEGERQQNWKLAHRNPVFKEIGVRDGAMSLNPNYEDMDLSTNMKRLELYGIKLILDFNLEGRLEGIEFVESFDEYFHAYIDNCIKEGLNWDLHWKS
jgi:hypothetical protein